MITFYIDDSGSKEVNDYSAQPNFLFSGIAVPNDKFIEANDFIEKESKNIGSIIMDKLVHSSVDGLNKKNVRGLLKQYLFREFELHATEMIHGKKEYICLSNDEKHELLKRIFQFIQEKEFKIIIIKCKKEDIVKNSEISAKEKQNYLNQKMMECIANEYERFLESIEQEGILVFDKGNDLVQNMLRKYIAKRENKRISPYIAQSKSSTTPLIQMADFTAYISNIYFNNQSKYHEELKPYFEMIMDNIIIYDVCKKD